VNLHDQLYLNVLKLKPNKMSLIRVILAVIFPPLSVLDKGCGSVIITLILTLLGWIPGVIAALVILNRGECY